MGLNKSKGNMYGFVTHTWNTVKGECPHGCYYCYMKQFKLNPIRFDEKELKTDLGSGNFIFVGSSCDMWAEAVPEEWILKTLEHCRKFTNMYLFQSKNPIRMLRYKELIPAGSFVGTTIETNRIYPQMGDTPSPISRTTCLLNCYGFKAFVTIEPIMDFDHLQLFELVTWCDPEFVVIGADSKGHNLPEPPPDKIKALIEALRGMNIEVKIKPNLKRLMR